MKDRSFRAADGRGEALSSAADGTNARVYSERSVVLISEIAIRRRSAETLGTDRTIPVVDVMTDGRVGAGGEPCRPITTGAVNSPSAIAAVSAALNADLDVVRI
jgi:hypothetical protein